MTSKRLTKIVETDGGVPDYDDILVPLQLPEDENLTPYPKIEYMVIEATTMDKLIRDVNTHLENGWHTEGGVQVTSGNITKFYQSLVRWNVDADTDKVLHIPGLENEPDLYEDIEKDAAQ